ncbi:Stress response protein nst1 [Myotisia sp. PD_48]|nr:Stress response protein nst1 [Myotisia sp. PD_48]
MPSNAKKGAASVPTRLPKPVLDHSHELPFPSLPATNASPSSGDMITHTATIHVEVASPVSATTSFPPRLDIDLLDLQVPGVNRKKQKRRQKQAARLAAEQQLNQSSSPTPQVCQNGTRQSHSEGFGNPHHTAPHSHQSRSGAKTGPVENAEAWYSDDDHQQTHAQFHSHSDNYGFVNQPQDTAPRKGKKKRRNRNRSEPHVEIHTPQSTPAGSVIRPIAPPPGLLSAYRSAHRISKDRIWNTSTHEERENIKEFWLQLGEDERRSLVKVEKEAVLRKMKEQQKHSCSCSVCGRKRTAIEEELEVLYDAYYEELEQYANNNQNSFENGAALRLPPRVYQTPTRSLDHHPHIPPSAQHPSRGRVHELPDDEEEILEDYDEDEEDDEAYSDDELDEETRTTRADFLAFGNSLTVKDGILTVADDLLKNDGKHFIDMMEQLAERRMQREEETQYVASSAAHQSMQGGHNHGPPLDDEDYDDEEDDDYDSQEDDDFEEDEMDTMTEEQRMEEGRRMFQIFAARMFEQRVLTAYREKVARERQQRLIEELEEENRLGEEREARKAKEAQKKKDRKRQQKQAKEEEKAKREAERAQEEAAQKAAEEKRLQEQQRKKEAQRKKKEAEKKALEDERLRKEAERQKRQNQERERQAEAERKVRDQKEKERKKREDSKKKERDERQQKEKELLEKKAKEEREQKMKLEQAKREMEANAKIERERKEKRKQEETPTQQPIQHVSSSPATKRLSQPGSGHLPPPVQHPQVPVALQSPHFQVATPVIPKAPTPVRPRQASQQGSHASSPRSQPAYADNSLASVSPGATGTSQSSGTSSVVSTKGLVLGQHQMLHHPPPSASMPSAGGLGRGPPPPGFNPIPNINGIPPNMGMGMGHRTSLGHDASMYQTSNMPMSSQFRSMGSADTIPMPPGITGPRNPVPGRGFGLDSTPLPFHPSLSGAGTIGAHPIQSSRDGMSHAHAGQASSFERSPLETIPQSQPLSRPAPIQPPSSSMPHDDLKSSAPDVDDLSAQLGSSALLDDKAVPLSSGPSQPISAGITPGPPGSGRIGGFGTTPLFGEPFGASKNTTFPLGPSSAGSTWGSGLPFGSPVFSSAASWGSGSGMGWSGGAFGIIGGPHRLNTSRPVTIRLLVCQACKQLSASSPSGGYSFHNATQVLRQIEQLNPALEVPISLEEMLDICDTEGNSQNGGGSLIVKNEGPRGNFVKFEPDNAMAASGVKNTISPGDIGSPIPGNSFPSPVGGGATPGSRHFPSMNVSSSTGF